MKGNNTEGAFVTLPSFRSLDKYMDHFKKPKSAIYDFIISVAKKRIFLGRSS
jgi:hypothetical protein